MKSYKKETIFQIQNQPVHVEITYKNMRRVLFRVHSGKLLVSAPFYTSEKDIEKMIPQLPPRFQKALFEDQDIGEDYIYLLGEKRRLVHILSSLPKEGAITYKDKEDLERKLKSLAVEILTQRVRYYEKIMEIEKPYHVKIHKTVSRYGSNAKRTHTLSFALTLIHYPISVIDAVVVHELAHDHHFDHSKAFYDEVLKYYPNYYQEMKRLKGGHAL
ncbi:MAG: DUF45 domain-containing protein [Coprobacillus sp.]|nr:DUF45 domain-containing protein [Coprobacillus sp.]